MLTAQQSRLLTYIDGRLKTGICPSYVEMQSAMGLASKSGIHRLLTGLETRGFIRRLSGRSRAIEIIRCPASGSSNGYDAGFRAGYVAALRAVIDSALAPA